MASGSLRGVSLHADASKDLFLTFQLCISTLLCHMIALRSGKKGPSHQSLSLQLYAYGQTMNYAYEDLLSQKIMLQIDRSLLLCPK